MTNRFDGVEKQSIASLIAQTVGAGSSPVLWMSEREGLGIHPLTEEEKTPEPATRDKWGRPCIFQGQEALDIVNESMEKLKEMLIAGLAKSGAVDVDDIEMLVGILLDEEDDDDR